MPRAEVGTPKHLANNLKSKGLQRLRWYCQPCQRQMRDENGYKCHVQSESHFRQMQIVGEDPKKHIREFSNQFRRDFLQLLRTAHGEKSVHANHFYQEYIANKEHVHMNATQWSSLTEFVKFLGREGICRVDEGDKGLHIAWIDNSPEALRRQDAIRRKERQDRGDEERDRKEIEEQVQRAHDKARKEPVAIAASTLQRRPGEEKISLNFSAKPKSSVEGSAAPTVKPKNAFAAAKKKNVAMPPKKVMVKEQPKESEAARIMRLEKERNLKRSMGQEGMATKRIRL